MIGRCEHVGVVVDLSCAVEWTTLTIYCGTSMIDTDVFLHELIRLPGKRSSSPYLRVKADTSIPRTWRGEDWDGPSSQLCVFSESVSVWCTLMPQVCLMFHSPDSFHVILCKLLTPHFPPWTRRGKCPTGKTGFRDLEMYCFLNSFQLFLLILASHSLHSQFQSNWICFSQPFEGSANIKLVVGFSYCQFSDQLSQVC